MEMNKKKLGLTTAIFIGLILGAIVGIVMHYLIPDNVFKNDFIIGGIFYVVSTD